jgi:CII-binding regulator of phage lambda lysogenization HflD
MNDMPEPTNPLQPGGASAYVSGMEARVAVLEEIARNTVKVLERIEASIVHLEERMDKRMKEMDDRLSNRMDRIENRQTSDFRWMLGLGIGFGGFLWASMAHGFHWF